MTKDYRNLSYKICMEGSQEHNNSRLRPVGKARTYLKGDETSLPIPSYALPTKHFKNTNRYYFYWSFARHHPLRYIINCIRYNDAVVEKWLVHRSTANVLSPSMHPSGFWCRILLNWARYNVNGSGVDAPREEIIHRWKLPQRQVLGELINPFVQSCEKHYAKLRRIRLVKHTAI